MMAVMILPQRNRLVLAKEVATLDYLSDERNDIVLDPQSEKCGQHAINYPVRNSERSSNSLLARYVEGTSNVVAITRSARRAISRSRRDQRMTPKRPPTEAALPISLLPAHGQFTAKVVRPPNNAAAKVLFPLG
jgi:alkanesulfonate monooxygenase SsuD/methylene tetrahydromethanopterin reductase-like flavin-dependent oxidoreductase (luciferase family)